MAGSLFFAIVVLVVGVVCAIVITPILWIPVGLIVLGALLVSPFAGVLGRMVVRSGRRPATRGEAMGTPSSADATYDPVDQPHATPRG
jgi:hypothetical protein